MHRCLNISEIQLLIFSHCNSESWGLAALVNLARTCTAFTESSFDVLWHDLPLIARLIQVMPTDLWMVEDEAREPSARGRRSVWKILKFTRALQESDWPRFHYYAKRVRRLGSGYDPLAGSHDKRRLVYVHEDVFRSLESFSPGQSLLPNLRTFRPAFYDPHKLPASRHIPMLLGPTITEITLASNEVALLAELQYILPSIERLCPNLTRLTVLLINMDVTPEITSAAERLVCSLRHLESLSLRPMMTANIIRHLGSLRGLRHWVTNIPSNTAGIPICELLTTERGQFRNLSRLEFRAPTLEVAADVTKSLQCPLQELSVDIKDKTTAQPISSLARLTGAFLGHQCISSLASLYLDGSPQLEVLSGPAICNAFRSLFSLGALRDLSITFPCASVLDDAWYADAAGAWPCLEDLSIAHTGPPVLTLAGLIPLIRDCPRLREIELSIRAEPFDVGLLQPQIRNTTITSLILGPSPIVNPRGVFRCLVGMFPKLESVACCENALEEHDDAWEKLDDVRQLAIYSPKYFAGAACCIVRLSPKSPGLARRMRFSNFVDLRRPTNRLPRMQNCLNITEIQHHIFSYCKSEIWGYGALANLARTCKAFTENSLDLLWHDLDRLAPLIQVMPSDLWAVEIEHRDTSARYGRCSWGMLKFTRALQESDWPRFHYYAKRVRRLGYNYSPPFEDRHYLVYVHEDVFKSLDFSRSGSSLLPNLRAFRPAFYDPHKLPASRHIPMLLGRTVTEICLASDQSALLVEIPHLLQSIQRCCPNLTRVTFVLASGMDITPEITSAAERLVCSLRHLEYLSLWPIMTTRITHHLGRLRELRHWNTEVRSDTAGFPIREMFTTEGGHFPNLCSFDLRASTLAVAAEVIESLQCPLRHLTVIITDETTAQPVLSLARFTGALPHHQCVASVRYLHLHGAVRLELSSGPAARQAFRSLFSLRALRSLWITLPCASVLDDDWYAAAADAWRGLECLRITHPESPVLTLAGLIPLIRNCRQLYELELSICAEPFDLRLLQPGICNTTITDLNLGPSPIVDTVGVFRCLTLMFPNLQSVACTDNVLPEHDDAWEKVSGMLEESLDGSTEVPSDTAGIRVRDLFTMELHVDDFPSSPVFARHRLRNLSTTSARAPPSLTMLGTAACSPRPDAEVSVRAGPFDLSPPARDMQHRNDASDSGTVVHCDSHGRLSSDVSVVMFPNLESVS
ncbi:hypothetical protein LshimejAT787_0111690 [Lyophyllum shimeji]|uniref:F-box domain-containing protein n=1 Tax=Lyophyllum shimeji TaxID=47721 RepID=A0A9P3UKA7_LYOSH|nr:hypothetical protein LshimejAT787_0111690 [Lyophyllum shimeji]